jgi:putative solute:sodium symporter small subunit
MQPSSLKHHDQTRYRPRYWQKTLALTFVLLVLWFCLTFLGAFHAETFNTVSFMGFPLGFYIFAQGNLFLYLLIILVYVIAMNRMERGFRKEGLESQSSTPSEPLPPP